MLSLRSPGAPGTNQIAQLLKSSKAPDPSPSKYSDRLSHSRRRESPCSNALTRRRFARTRLARQCSHNPSAMRQRSSRLRRQVLGHIELRLSPQPSVTPPRPTSLPRISERHSLQSPTPGWTSGAARTVEVELEFETPSLWPPQAGTHCPAPDGFPEHCQASRVRAERQRSLNSSKRGQTARKSQR
jgi:hypothetical protein